MNINERINQLLIELNKGIYEKELEIGMSLLAALAGESVLLLGPPGVAKSMVARRLKEAFANAKAFEYLMSRFSTPDEIFGPVSISRLKDSDKYERIIEGYVPTSDIVFLDEIWKAGPAIQNVLLTAINEKLFRNGDKEISLPMKLLIAASNELPAQGEGLEAIWDRFLVRLTCSCVKDENVFCQMLLDDESENNLKVDSRLKITSQEYKEWQESIRKIELSKEVITCIRAIRKQLGGVYIEGSEHPRIVYVSDRRWKHIIRLLKASAFMHSRNVVSAMDLLPIYHCLWNEPEEQNGIRDIVIHSLFNEVDFNLVELNRVLTADLKVINVKTALKKMKNKPWIKNLKIVNHFYFQLENHGTGHTYIYAADFLNLSEYNTKNAPIQGVMYQDPRNKNQTLIRTYAGVNLERLSNAENINLRRKDDILYINGVEFKLRHLQRGEGQEEINAKCLVETNRDYGKEIEDVAQQLNSCISEVEKNMFLTVTDRSQISTIAVELRKRIALTRVDIEKIYSQNELSL